MPKPFQLRYSVLLMSTISLHSRIEVKNFKLIEIFWYNYAERKLRKRRIWSYLLKKSLMENFIFCAVIASGKASKWVQENIS